MTKTSVTLYGMPVYYHDNHIDKELIRIVDLNGQCCLILYVDIYDWMILYFGKRDALDDETIDGMLSGPRHHLFKCVDYDAFWSALREEVHYFRRRHREQNTLMRFQKDVESQLRSDADTP